MIERTYKKLALDALVIQQGRLAEQKSNAFLISHLFSLLLAVDLYVLFYTHFYFVLYILQL